MSREHHPDPERSDAGIVEPIRVSGGLGDHAAVVAQKVADIMSAGVPAERIAVLYPRRGRLLELVLQALTEAAIPFVHERDQRLPTGPIVEFLRRSAARRLAGPQPCGHQSALDTPVSAPTIRQLSDEYISLCGARRPRPHAVDIGERLISVVDEPPDSGTAVGSQRVSEFIQKLDHAVELVLVAASSREQRDHSALEALRNLDADVDLTLEEFAGPEVPLGKLTVTTYHSAKGREFSVVVLPGLVEGIVPRLSWSKRFGRYEEPARAVVAEDRRTFYVAITRAADAAVLIYGPGFETEWGAWNELGPSRFVVDVIEGSS
jgi:DNA helicase-2/ATP-dependent DNA helicase PcrA